MKWDIKIAIYLFLAYTLYGVSFVFTHGDFVVPLPIFFYLIPFVALVFLLTSGFNKFSIFFVLFPLGVISDWAYTMNAALGDLFVIIGMISWGILALVLFFDKSFKQNVKKYPILVSIPIIYLLSFLMLFDNQLVKVLLFLFLGVASGIIVRKDLGLFDLNKSVRRLFIFSSFVSWMFIITFLSVYLTR